MQGTKKINHLNHGLEGYIRACSAISSVHTAVEELILNSIDAEASKIQIYVKFPFLKNQSMVIIINV